MPGRIGLISIARYPVKGLGGELLESALLGLDGLAFDRVLGLSNGLREVAPFGTWTAYDGFHALAGRADLARYSARVIDEDFPGRVTVEIRRDDGAALQIPVSRNALTSDGFEKAAGVATTWFGADTPRPADLVNSGAHLWDVAQAPISVINLETIRRIEARAGHDLDPARFRANLYIDGLSAWEELSLVGRTAQIGAARIGFWTTIDRCRATSAHPRKGVYDINVPGLLQQQFGHIYCGLYAQVLEPGIVRAGDDLVLDPVRVPVPFDTFHTAAAPRFAQVVENSQASTTVMSVTLSDPTGLAHGAAPGQHLRVHRTDGDLPVWRDYSVSAVDASNVRVSVGLQEHGQMSPWMHERRPGDQVLISGPFGTAVDTSSSEPLLIVTGGIGITPALAVLHSLSAELSSRTVRFVHVNRGIDSLAHWDEVGQLVSGLDNTSSQLFITGDAGACTHHHERGRPSADLFATFLEQHPTSTALVCGSVTFTQAMIDVLCRSGMPRARIHTDPFYSPRPADVTNRRAPLPGPFSVTFDAETAGTWTDERGTLLDLALEAGLNPPSSCHAGVCGSCAARVEGDIAYITDPLVAVPEGQDLLCCTVPMADIAVHLSE